MAKKCERCGKAEGARTKEDPNGIHLFDYCANCQKNLCPACMAQGCCKKVPADSGMKADYGDE
jgi:hypothetical protein